MPKNVKLPEHLEELRQDLESGNTKTKHNQYVTRIDTALAIRFVEDCIETGDQPSERLRDILIHYYRTKDQTPFSLDQYQERVVKALASHTGQSPQEVVNQLISEFGMDKLQQIRNLLPKPKNHTNSV